MRESSAEAPPIWVRTNEALAGMAAHLANASIIALDTESDSLHHFPEKVCLLQIAHPDGSVYLVDPLALSDLTSLGAICADPAIRKVLHGASYDVASLKRDFAFRFTGLTDTMVAAQLLGLAKLGLSDLLTCTFGIAACPSRQKDDWARRPLSAEQEIYAAADVRNLIPLHERLLDEIRNAGREAWLTEECAALEEIPASLRVFDPDGFLSLKGARELDGSSLSVLRALFAAREEWAHAFGRPPFRLLGAEAMLAIAREKPRTPAALLCLPGCTPKVVDRLGTQILAAVAEGLSLPASRHPVIPRRERPRMLPAVQRRVESLIAWRVVAAERLKLDPGVLLPRRLIERLAEAAPSSPADLLLIDGIRRWRVASLGSEILAVLNGRSAERSERPLSVDRGTP
ncbi:MAG: HRDC domain-containing protein [Candidatus Methylomirabilota bacterium]